MFHWPQLQCTSLLTCKPFFWWKENSCYSSFSGIGFRFYWFCRIYRIMREQKNSVEKCFPQEELNPGTSDFQVLHATISANSLICWKSKSFRSLCSHALLILGLKFFFRINRAWLQKDLKGWDFQQMGELAQSVACRTWKFGLTSQWGNILLLDFSNSLVILQKERI